MFNLKQKNRNYLVFKHWTHKSYSAFNSLKQVIKIGMLSAAYSILTVPAAAQSDRDSLRIDKFIDIDEVEVTGESAPVIFSQESRVITVISRKEIESAPAQNIQELLEYAMNVDLRTRGANDIQADVSLRGGSFDQTLILLNGVNVNDPQTGHLSLNLPIDIANIERIEILYGPAARVFGSNAFNGAINFITGTKDKNNIQAYGSYGAHNTSNSGAAMTIVSGKVKNFISASTKYSDGYTDNTDFKGKNVFYQGILNTSKADVDFQFGYNAKDFGALNFYSQKYMKQYEENETYFAALKANFGKKIKITPALYWRQHNDHFVLFRDKPELYQNFHRNTTMGAKLRGLAVSKLGKSTFGAEYRVESIISNNIGEALADSVMVSGHDDYYYNKSYERTHLSVFADHSVFFDRFSVSGGLMFHYLPESEDFGFYPGIDLSYKIADKYKLFASVNRSMRMPTFTELYYTDPVSIGNKNLKPEKSLTYELGMKYHRDGVRAHLSLFKRHGSDIIDWVFYADEKKWKASNLSEFDAQGIETSFVFLMNELFDDPFVNTFSLAYSYTNVTNLTKEYETRYALDNLKHKLTVSLNHKIYRQLTASWKFAYQKRNGSYQKYLSTTDSYETTDYKSFATTDLRVSWVDKQYTVYAEASNLFDVKYFDFGGVDQPGRWIRAGLKLNLDF